MGAFERGDVDLLHPHQRLSDAPGDDDVRCERDGDHVRFWIPAGLGTRTLVALARDATGHVFVGDARTLELTRR